MYKLQYEAVGKPNLIAVSFDDTGRQYDSDLRVPKLRPSRVRRDVGDENRPTKVSSCATVAARYAFQALLVKPEN